jgi:signal transduction histidine kinase/DNA-binding response OmpR family regulator
MDAMDEFRDGIDRLLQEDAESLYEDASCGYMTIAVSGSILKLNRTLASWLGRDRDELLQGVRFGDLVPIGARIFLDTHFFPLLHMHGHAKEIAVDLYDASRRIVPVLVNAELKRDTAGIPRVIRLTLFNVTERRRYERELLEARKRAEIANATLELRVAERTEHLAEALRSAEIASKAKSTFLASMSHEIRTPLNAVIGTAHLGLESSDPLKQREYFKRITVSSGHLFRIITDILDFSKLEAGKVDIRIQPIPIRDLVDDISAVYTPLARAKGLRFSTKVADNAPHAIQADSMRLVQILSNYLDNAIKFTPRGGIELVVETMSSGTGAVVRCAVSDSGIGLTEEQRKNLFQPFRQADESITRKYGGTGLGLAISRHLAGLMCAEVGMSGNSGEGSCFWIDFPWNAKNSESYENGQTEVTLVGPEAGKPAPDSRQADIAEARAAVRGMRVLLAEDNVFNQELFVEFADNVGIALTTVNNGAEALQALEQGDYQCVLMDLQMPVMDGLTATRLIRMKPAYAKLPIIAVTANAFDDDKAECIAAGMDESLAKPVFPDDFYLCLAHWGSIGMQKAHTPAVPGAGNERPGDVDSIEGSDASKDTSLRKVPHARGDTNEAVVIDLKILEELTGNDAQKVRRFALRFLDSARDTVKDLHDAILFNDLDRINDLGHRLKSSARACGAIRCSEIAVFLENLSALADARPHLEELERQISSMPADIERYAGSA